MLLHLWLVTDRWPGDSICHEAAKIGEKKRGGEPVLKENVRGCVRAAFLAGF